MARVSMTHPDNPAVIVARTDGQREVFERHGWTVDESAEGAAPDGTLRPADSASKAAWVDFAVRKGADPEAAEQATKNDLIAAYSG